MNWMHIGIGWLAISITLLILWAIKEWKWPCPVIKDACESDGADPHLVKTVLTIGNTRAEYPPPSRSARIDKMHDPMGV